jgi:ABC-2 type transport system permease protein
VAGVLIRLKLTLLKHALRGGQATFLQLGAVVGGLFAAWLLVVGLGAGADEHAAFDILALAFSLLAGGWILLSTAGGDPLRPETLALLPIDRRRLARLLLITSLVGVTPAVTLVSLCSLVVAAWTTGPAAVVVAVVATALTLPLVSLLALVIGGLSAQAVQSRFGVAVAGLARGLLVALVWIWVPLTAMAGGSASAGDLAHHPVIATVTRLLPTGWGVAAVEAVRAESWPLAIGLLLVLIGGVLILLEAWARLLDRRLTQPGSASSTSSSDSGWAASMVRRLATSRFGAPWDASCGRGGAIRADRCRWPPRSGRRSR